MPVEPLLVELVNKPTCPLHTFTSALEGGIGGGGGEG